MTVVAVGVAGTGKYLGCNAGGGFLLGSDASVNLLHVCKERLPEVNQTHVVLTHSSRVA